MSSLSQNLSKLWQFLWVKVRRNLNFSKFWNLEISLNFWYFCPIFCMWAQFLNIFNLCIATWGLKQLHPWFPRGGIRYPPLAWDEIDNPLEIGLSHSTVKANFWMTSNQHSKFKTKWATTNFEFKALRKSQDKVKNLLVCLIVKAQLNSTTI